MEKPSLIILIAFVLGSIVAFQSLQLAEQQKAPEIAVYWGVIPRPGRKMAWVYVFNLGGETVDYVNVELETRSPTIIWRYSCASSRDSLERRIDARRMSKEARKEVLSHRIRFEIEDIRPDEHFRFYYKFLIEGRYTVLRDYINDWRDREIGIQTIDVTVESSCESQGGVLRLIGPFIDVK